MKSYLFTIFHCCKTNYPQFIFVYEYGEQIKKQRKSDNTYNSGKDIGGIV